MKSSRIFWGTFFVILGGLILLNNFFYISLPWHTIWKFWPIVIILIGISALTKGKEYRWLINATIAVIAGFVLFASVQNGCSHVRGVFEGNGEVYSNTLEVDSDSAVEFAEFKVEGGAGRYTLEGVTDKLGLAKTKTNFGSYVLKRSDRDMKTVLELSLKEKNIRWQGGKFKNSVLVALNNKPVWDFDFNLGAAAVDLDLTEYKARNVSLNVGAASIDMKLGTLYDETYVSIDAGASAISIEVPESVACEVRSDTELSSIDVHGFTKTDRRLYRTPAFESGTKRIYIEIDAGISSIDIRRVGNIEEIILDEDTLEIKTDSIMF